jgi:hypothetical protein
MVAFHGAVIVVGFLYLFIQTLDNYNYNNKYIEKVNIM